MGAGYDSRAFSTNTWVTPSIILCKLLPPRADIFPERAAAVNIEAHDLGSPDAVNKVLQDTLHLEIKQM